MQAIKVGDEIVFLARIVCGLRHCEGHVFQPYLIGPFACGQDRGFMVIEAEEGRCGIGLCHDDGGCSKPAADIRDFLESFQ